MRLLDDPVPRVRAAKMANGAHKPEDALITVEPLRKNQMQPTYAQTLEIDESSGGSYGKMINCLGGIAGTFGSIPCCFICPNPYKEVKQGYVGLVTRYGQFYKSVDPGLTKINPFSESLKMVNVQIQVCLAHFLVLATDKCLTSVPLKFCHTTGCHSSTATGHDEGQCQRYH